MHRGWLTIAAAAALPLSACAGGHGHADRTVDPDRLFTQPPSVGVACRQANSIACDRVGVAVWPRGRAARVVVSVQGRRLALHPRRAGGWWEGYLQPAGLVDGPLRVTPDRGRLHWIGSHPRDARVAVAVTRPSGAVERTSTVVPLRPGWG